MSISPKSKNNAEGKVDYVTFLPYNGLTLNRISRLLFEHDIKTLCLMPKKFFKFLRHFKDDLALKTPDIYTL